MCDLLTSCVHARLVSHLLSQRSQGVVQAPAQLPQVGQAAGSDAAVWVSGSTQEDIDQRGAQMWSEVSWSSKEAGLSYRFRSGHLDKDSRSPGTRDGGILPMALLALIRTSPTLRRISRECPWSDAGLEEPR